MRWLSAGLTFVNVATVAGLLLGLITGGIGRTDSIIALLAAACAAVLAFHGTVDPKRSESPVDDAPAISRFRQIPFWALLFFFAIFAFRSFCWLIYADGDTLRIQSPNNLGDLGLHITLINNFASHVSLWPEHPLFVFSKLRYPAGVDLFNALTVCAGIDLQQALVWTGLVATAATFYAFYRWAGLFGASAFLFNGGMAGYQLFRTLEFLDYQGDKAIAWKSIPLSMFVTQRGLLYAIPAGIVLLWQWRQRFFGRTDTKRALLPTWVEFSLYATMPLFHAHTFMALSVVLLFLFLFGTPAVRGSVLTVVAVAFIPASLLVWMITDHFAAKSVLEWHLGWAQTDGDFKTGFFRFWILNFGIWPVLALVLVALTGWRGWRTYRKTGQWPEALPFVAAATTLFLICCTLKTAPWIWDNMKILIWAYFIVLPFLWRDLIATWPAPTRAAVYVSLFLSGFVSLFGGLAMGRPGYEFASREELDFVGSAVRKLPPEARFAAFPTYNHPLLLQGRKLVLGYPGHLWTEGLDDTAIMNGLNSLMLGKTGWRDIATRLRVRYLFWGREEQEHWAESARPWERELTPIAKGAWGAIYDLGAIKAASQP